MLASRHQKIRAFLGSRLFFSLSLALFAVESGWIALSNKFPLAFDESYHYGLINLYSHQWSPFIAHQPIGADGLGAVTRYPSYLFHYLMSFPYRIFHALVPSFAANIIFMRFLDIVLFAVGLVLFRKVLLAAKVSRALTNVLLLAFVLLPVVPFLAATINYDNLLFPLIAAAVLLALRLLGQLKEWHEFSLVKAAWLVTVCCLASLTMYSFLPIFVGVTFFVAGYVWFTRRQGKLRLNWQASSRWAMAATVLALTISFGLFVERYGINTLRYHTPLPQCDKVLSVQECSTYGAWARNYALAQSHEAHITIRQFLGFNHLWLSLMTKGAFAVVSSNGGSVQSPVKLLELTIVLVVIVGMFAIVYHWRRLMKMGLPLGLFLVIGACYLGVLWLQNYSDFTRLGIPVAIQARYAVMILPLLIVLPGMGLVALLRDRPRLNLAVATAATAVFLLVGGVATYVLRSNDTWYWPNSPFAKVNSSVRHVLAVADH